MSASKGLSIAIASILLVILASGGLYWSTPLLLNWQLEQMINDLDCQSQSAEFERPSWHQIRIPHLDLNQCSLGIKSLQVDGLQIDYSPRQLLTEYRLKALTIDRLHSEYELRPATSKGSSLPPLPGQLLQQLPLDQLHIKTLNLTLLTQAGIANGLGQLDVNSDRMQSQLNLQWIAQGADISQPVSLDADIRWNQQDQFSLELSKDGLAVYQLSGQLALAQQQLRLQAEDQLLLQPALSWVQDWATDLDLDGLNLDGQLTNHWSATLPMGFLAGDLKQSPDIQQRGQLSFNSNKLPHQLLESINAELSFQADWGLQDVLWQITSANEIALTFKPGSLPHPALSEHWQLHTDTLRGRFHWAGDWNLLSHQGQLQIRATEKDKLALTADLSQLYLNKNSISTRFSSQVSNPQLAIRNLRVNDLSGHINGLMAVHSNNISLKLDRLSYLQARRLRQNSLDINAPKLVILDPIDLQTAFASQQWVLSPLKLTLATAQLELFDWHAQALSGQLAVDGNPNQSQQLSGQLSGVVHDLQLGEQTFTDIGLQLPFELNYPSLKLKPRLSWPANSTEAITLNGALNYQLPQRQGQGILQLPSTPISRIAQQPWIKEQLARQQITVSAGNIQAAAEFSLAAKGDDLHWQSQLQSSLNNLNSRYQEWQFSGMAAQLQAQLNDAAVATARFSSHTDTINGFIPFSDFKLDGHFTDKQSERLQIDTAEVQVLDGKLDIEPFEYNFKEQSASMKVTLKQLDLQQIVKLQSNQDIHASGRLSGLLPVDIKQDKFRISDGQLAADAPGGQISYTPANADLLSTNPGMKIALSALSDFRYHQLSALVNYQPDGTLWLDTSLKGQNPNWQQGQPIDFNIRIEQNLLKLIQALQFSDNLSKGLDQQIRQRMQQ